ncbi:MAG: hypothetical protein IKE53_02810 [Clostridiales bacterium]|nr:hypothetical protein [Clostridiales bacterium]
MKKTQIKDTVRNIRKQLVSYISVVVIAMLAVMAYLGINFASAALASNGNDFYDETRFRDVEVLSTYLVTPDDIEQLRAVPGVSYVEGFYYTTGKIAKGDVLKDADILSLTTGINVPKLISGRLPENSGECVLEQPIAEEMEIKEGDTIVIQNNDGDPAEYMTLQEFTVTGIVFHPDHVCWPLQLPGNRNVIVMPEAFDQEKLEGCFMKADIRIEGTEGMDRFSSSYFNTVEETLDRINKLAEERQIIRFNEIKDKYSSEIDEGQSKLDEAQARLEDARNELDENRNRLIDGEAELADAARQIEENEQRLSDAEEELASGRSRLEDGRNQLAASERQLRSALAQLNSGEAELAEAGRRLEEGRAQLAEAESQLESGREELVSTYGQMQDKKSEIISKLRNAMISVVGERITDLINWSEISYDLDVDDPNASATSFPITQSITLDLSRSMGDNIFHVLSLTGVPEEELKEAYETITGEIMDIVEGHTILETLVSIIESKYSDLESKYETMAGYARSWNSGHEEYLSGVATYNSKKAEYDDGLAQYNAGRAELDRNWRKYRDGQAEYESARRRLNEGQAEYDRGLREYQDGQSQLEDGRRQYEQGLEELESGRAALEDGENQYSTNMELYNDNAAALEQAREDLRLLEDCRWIVFDVMGNPGYVFVHNCQKNVGSMGMTFALAFVVVGALVIYATVGRIVDEQRQLVGTTKALGFFNREILGKYLTYGVSGTVTGSALGIIAGYFGIQRIMLYVYGKYFVYDAARPTFVIHLAVIVVVCGIVLSGATVWSACSGLIKAPARELMQIKSPAIRRRSSKGRSKNLYGKLLLLNMLTDKKRVAVTVVSIAGCCALLVAGLSMRTAIQDSLEDQFRDIEVYDAKIQFSPEISESACDEIAELLRENNIEFITLSDTTQQAYQNGDKLSTSELLTADLNDLDSYFIRRDPKSYEPVAGEGDGVWIHIQTAERLGLTSGGEITLYTASMKPCKVPVAGVFQNYAGRQMIMSRTSYEKYMGKAAQDDAFLVEYNGANADTIRDRLSQIEGFKELSDVSETMVTYRSFTSVLDLIAVLFIFIAGLMAYFILLNLVNMYINQKKRELCIMRINGFTVRQVKRYVSLELVASNIIGIMLGWVAGSALIHHVILLIEGMDLRFIRDIQYGSWAVAAVITSVFTGVIGWLAMRKIKNLKLSDIA